MTTAATFTADEIQDEARAVLNTRPGCVYFCTFVGSMDEQRKAAQRALDGDTADLEMMIAMHGEELWRRAEWYQDQWFDNWQPTASESTVPTVCA